jgi:hypothetical protein
MSHELSFLINYPISSNLRSTSRSLETHIASLIIQYTDQLNENRRK